VAGAQQRFGEALAAAQAAGAERLAEVIALSLAEAEFRGGDALTALRLGNEALLLNRALLGTTDAAVARSNVAAYLVGLRRYDEARIAAREALAGARDMQWSVGIGWILQHLAAIVALRPSDDARAIEDRRRAARILGYVDASFAVFEALRYYTEQQEYDKMLPALRDALGADECTRLMAEGSTWGEDQAVAEAMLI
jgi:tetratricopeptide (TPR) repeat protein